MAARSVGKKMTLAALIMGASILLSRLIGFVRERVIANMIGATRDADIYYAAFTIPDFLNYLLAGGAISITFIPIFSAWLVSGKEREGWRVFSLIVTVMGLGMMLLIGGAMLFAEQLVPIIAPGFSPEHLTRLARVVRIILPAQLFFYLGGLFTAVQFAKEKFLYAALAPLVYNGGIIVGALFLTGPFGVYGLIYGAILGALGHLLIQVPGLLRYGLRYRPILGWDDPDLRHILRLMGPRVLNIIVIQVNFIVMFNLASYLGEGGVSALDYGWDLMQMPQTLIGSAIGIVLFPTLSELAARNDRLALRQTLAQTLRIILALSIPAMVGLIVLGRPVIQLLFERGQFGPDSTATVYQALQFWAVALIAHSALEVVNRVFYAQKDTVTPFLSSLVSMVLNIGLAYALYRPLGAGGLALSNGLAVTVEVLIMLVIAHRRLGGIQAEAITNTLLRSLLAATVMGLAVVAFTTALPTLSPLFITSGGGFIGLGAYLIAGFLFRVEEIRLLPRLVRS